MIVNEAMRSWGVGIGVIVGVSAFLRFCPKEKLLGWIRPKAFGLGLLVSKTLILRLGKRAAERVEEGVIVTFAAVISEAVGKFVDGLLSDNEKRKRKK